MEWNLQKTLNWQNSNLRPLQCKKCPATNTNMEEAIGQLESAAQIIMVTKLEVFLNYEYKQNRVFLGAPKYCYERTKARGGDDFPQL